MRANKAVEFAFRFWQGVNTKFWVPWVRIQDLKVNVVHDQEVGCVLFINSYSRDVAVLEVQQIYYLIHLQDLPRPHDLTLLRIQKVEPYRSVLILFVVDIGAADHHVEGVSLHRGHYVAQGVVGGPATDCSGNIMISTLGLSLKAQRH